MKLLITGGSGFIGTNLVIEAEQRGLTLLNVDIKKPFNSEHQKYWYEISIMEKEKLIKTFQSFQPAWVIHLAARTDIDENTTVEEGYKINTKGTANVLSAIKSTPTVKGVIITSTQFVFKSDKDLPKNYSDYRPHTVYGQSKVITEKLTREANLDCIWTIIRPTTIWGPGDLSYRKQFYQTLQNNCYFHPKCKSTVRSYGFVENVIHQIFKILLIDKKHTDKKVFYLGDRPIEVKNWVQEFLNQINGKTIKEIPIFFFKIASLIGDLYEKILNRRFIIDSNRLKSMTESYPVPIEDTFKILGDPLYSIEESVKKTLKWLKQSNNV